jgi:hypothetical protein
MEKLQTRLEETPSPVEAVNKAGSSACGVKQPPFYNFFLDTAVNCLLDWWEILTCVYNSIYIVLC